MSPNGNQLNHEMDLAEELRLRLLSEVRAAWGAALDLLPSAHYADLERTFYHLARCAVWESLGQDYSERVKLAADTAWLNFRSGLTTDAAAWGNGVLAAVGRVAGWVAEQGLKMGAQWLSSWVEEHKEQ